MAVKYESTFTVKTDNGNGGISSVVTRPPPPQPSAIFIPSPAVDSSDECLRHCLATIDNDIIALVEERRRIVMEFEARCLKKPDDCPIVVSYVVKEIDPNSSLKMNLSFKQRAKNFLNKIAMKLGLKTTLDN